MSCQGYPGDRDWFHPWGQVTLYRGGYAPFVRLPCGRRCAERWPHVGPPTVRAFRSGSRESIPRRGVWIIGIGELAAVEHRQSRNGVDREPGEHLGLRLVLDLPRLKDDVAHEGLEHLRGDADVALQQVT